MKSLVKKCCSSSKISKKQAGKEQTGKEQAQCCAKVSVTLAGCHD